MTVVVPDQAPQAVSVSSGDGMDPVDVGSLQGAGDLFRHVGDLVTDEVPGERRRGDLVAEQGDQGRQDHLLGGPDP